LGYATTGLLAGVTPLATAIREAASARDVELVPEVSPATQSYAELIARAAPQALIIDRNPTDSGEAAAALRQAGWSGSIIGGNDLTQADYAAIAGDAAAASCVTAWPLAPEVQGGEAFVARYVEVSAGIPPGRLALPAYEATWLLIQAVQANIAAEGAPTRAGVIDALPAVARDGLLGPITFDAQHKWENAPLYECEVRVPRAD
jgi:ABC-type branched-subunit amino acid transport system substrate-binding protein